MSDDFVTAIEPDDGTRNRGMNVGNGSKSRQADGTGFRTCWMLRGLAASSILISAACIAVAQIRESQPLTVTLPPGVPSEKVYIGYVLAGPFGGYGNYVRPQADVDSYSIPTSVEGKPAESIQMVVWAPGCETRTFTLRLREDDQNELHFECTIFPMVTLTGHIHPVDLVRGEPSEVAIWFLAHWQCKFFGWSDCMVPQFEVATAQPDANGFFEVQVPDFSSDPIAGDTKRWGAFTGEFRVGLREIKTWNRIASLQTELREFRTPGAGGLTVTSVYPSDLVFVAETPD